MSAASVATTGMTGAIVALTCYVTNVRYGVSLPDYVVASLMTLTAGVGHGVHFAVSLAWQRWGVKAP